MKLKDLLLEWFENESEHLHKSKKNFEELFLMSGEELVPFKEEILRCDEFKECTDLEILTIPLLKDVNGKPINLVTFKLGDGQKFKGQCYLFSLSLTPELFDPNELYKPVKDGASILPTTHSEITFEPIKEILLAFNSELILEDSDLNKSKLREEMHLRLDKILDNPQDYMVKGYRDAFVYGIFEIVDDYKMLDESFPLIQDNKNIVVYYKETPDLSDKLKPMLIPKVLREKFQETFKNIFDITKEMIEKFLEENK